MATKRDEDWEDKMIAGMIFDFNGTLFWDSPQHEEAWIVCAKELREAPLTAWEYREKIHGHVNRDIVAYLAAGPVPEEEVLRISARKEEIYRELCRQQMEQISLAPGAAGLLDYLKAQGIPRAVATSADGINMAQYKEWFGLSRWFPDECLVYNDGSFPGKPAPDIFEMAAARLGLPPQQCVVAEDTSTGVEAAYRAGVGKIVVIAPGDAAQEFRGDPRVDWIVEDFDGVDRRIFHRKEEESR